MAKAKAQAKIRSHKKEMLDISPSEVRTTKLNPRIINMKSAKFADLVESVKASGVIVPVHVRPHPNTIGIYELLAGERRLKAAITAKLVMLPAVCHHDITDEEAFEITFTENFGREDLTPLEEGKAAATLLEKFNGDAKAAASKMGKSERWIRQHAKIDENLCSFWKDVLQNNEDLQYMTAAHLALIARWPEETQKALYKELNTGFERSVKQLERLTADLLRLLKKAPFKTDGCENCIKRSSVQPTLWDNDEKKVTGDKDRCLDPACWEKKMIAKKQEKVKGLRKKHPGLLCVAREYVYDRSPDGQKLKKIYGKYVDQYSFSEVKETNKQAKPALVVAGKGKGKIIYIKLKSNSSSSSSSKPKATPLKQLRIDLEIKRWRQVCDEFYDHIEKMEFSDLPVAKQETIVLSMATCFGTEPNAKHSDRLKVLGSYDKQHVLITIWDDTRESITWSTNTSGSAESVAELKAISALIELPVEPVYKDVCSRDEFKEPVEWANLNVNGTAKAAKKAKKKAVKKKVAKKAAKKAVKKVKKKTAKKKSA